MVSTSIDNPPPSSLDSNETSSGGGFSVARTEGRIGAPAPLRPLPLQFTTPGAFLSLLENYTEDFTVKAVEILSECGVEFDDIDFGARAAPRPDAASMPTILVYASWKPNSLEIWSDAVRHIKLYADSRLSASDHFSSQSVAVEIVDLELVDRPKTIGPVLSENPQLELDWPQIQQRVLEILEGFDSTRDKWNTISLLRLGYSEKVKDNPVTVFISVDDVIPDSASILRQIQGYLNTLTHDLVAHMEENTIDLYTAELF